MSCSSTKELHWGITHVANVQPQNRRLTAFASIKNNLYISSDGLNSYIWDTDGVKQCINLPAISLHYIKEIDHIISTVKNSKHLHFIWMLEPSTVSVHPLPFSIRSITSLFYLPKSQTLVTSGQGITFSKMTIPKFAGRGSISQLIEFSKQAELYHNEIFTRITAPLFIESEDSIAVPIEKSVFVHSSNGSLIGSMVNLMEGRVSSLSYFAGKRLFVVGDEFGNVSFVDWGHFYSKITTNIGNHSHILMASLFDRYFLVTVSLDKCLSLINVDTESKIDTIKIDSEIITARVVDDRVLIFSSGIDVFIYEVSIFTKFLTHLTANALKIERFLEPRKPSTLFCFQKDFIVSSFFGKSGRKIIELMSSSLSNEIVDFIFDSDSLFLRFFSGNIVRVEIVHQSDLFAVSNSINDDDRNSNLKKSVIKVPQTVNNVVQIIKYSKSDGEKCILALSESGQIYAFSVEKGLLFDKSYIGCQDLICGVFLHTYNRFVFSTKTEMIIVDSESLHVVKRMDRAFITCFLTEDSKSCLFVGDAHGCVETFELPTLSSISKSLDFNKSHSSNGKRLPLSEFQTINEIPYAVKYLSYLKSRDLLISVSNEGEIFLWNSDMFPFAHINFSFGISAGCFYDSNGSLLVSSFNCLFVIPYTYFFLHPVDETSIKCNDDYNENIMLDEFNRFDMEIERPFSSVKVSPNIDTIKSNKNKQNETKKKRKLEKIKKLEFDTKIDETKPTELIRENQNNENKVKFIISSDNETDENHSEENQFNDLIVDLDSFPKNHFVEISTQKKFINRPKFPIDPIKYPKESENTEIKPAPPPPEKTQKKAPRNSKCHKRNKKSKKPKKTKKIEKTDKNEFLPKPPAEKQSSENLPVRKKIQFHAHRNIYTRNNQNDDLNQTKLQPTENIEKEKDEYPPFDVEVNKKIPNNVLNDNNNNNEKVRPNTPTFITNDNNNNNNNDDDFENHKNNGNRRRNYHLNNDGTENSSVFHSQYVEFIEPKYDYGSIGKVTMEELEDYMRKNTVFLKKAPSSQRRSKSLRNSQYRNQNQFNNNNNRQIHFPKVTRIQRNSNNSKQFY